MRLRALLAATFHSVQRSDRGTTAVEYGIMVAVFGVGMVIAGAALVTAGKANYAATESRVGNPNTVCVGDEIFDSVMGKCVPNPMKIISVTPNTGSSSGGTAVVIRGTAFASGAQVLFGSASATGVIVDSDTQIRATTPAGVVGPADVTVRNTTDIYMATGYDYFTYLGGSPTIVSVSPPTGPSSGGTVITVTGTNFATGATVTVGGVAATAVTVTNSTSLTATTPPGTAGAQRIVVTNPDSQATVEAVNFTYTAGPTISGVNPASGPLAGDRTVTIDGGGFESGATVSVGAVSAVSVTWNSATQLTAVFPGGAAGAQSVTVTNPDTQSFTLPGAYTYLGPPTATTLAASAIAVTSATMNGSVNAAGSSTTVTFVRCLDLGMTNTCVTTTASPATASGTGATAVSVAASGLQGGTQYFFRVVADSAGGNVSGSVQSFTTVAATRPGAPTAVTATRTGTGEATVAWTPPIDDGGQAITGYTVDFQTAGVTSATTCNALTGSYASATATTTATSAVKTGLGSAWHCVRVFATNGVTSGAINYAYGGPVNTALATRPGAPTITSLVGTDQGSTGRVVVTWTPPADDGGQAITGYTVDFDEVNGATSTCDASLAFGDGSETAGGSATTATESNLTDRDWFCVRIFASNGVTTGAINYGYAGPVYTAVSRPGMPTNVSATVPVSGSITLTWDPPLSNGGSAIDSYQPEYAAVGGSLSDCTNANGWSGSDVATSPRSRTWTGLNASTWYCVRVRAENTASDNNGDGPYAYYGPLRAASTALAVTAVSPASGPVLGNRTVTITGENFVTGASVAVGSTTVSATVDSDTQITAVFPAKSANTYDVSVTVGANTVTLANAYTYAGPRVTAVLPTSGPLTGNRTVTITGTNFATGASVTVGTTAAVSAVVDSSTQITAVLPGNSAGTYAVTVTMGGSSDTLGNAYTYRAVTRPGAPAIGNVSESCSGWWNPTCQATVNWTLADDGGDPSITFTIQRAPAVSSGGWNPTWSCPAAGSSNWAADQTTSALSYQYTGLSSQRYCFRVSAENSAGTGSWGTSSVVNVN